MLQVARINFFLGLSNIPVWGSLFLWLMWDSDLVKIFFLHVSVHFFNIIYWGDYSFSIVISLFLCSYMSGFISGLSILLHWWYACFSFLFLPMPCYFDYYRFVILHRLLCSFSQGCLAIWSLLWVHIYFRIFFFVLFLWKMSLVFW